jgi:hypothetical protein
MLLQIRLNPKTVARVSGFVISRDRRRTDAPVNERRRTGPGLRLKKNDLIPLRVWQNQSQLKRLLQEPYPNWLPLQPDKNDFNFQI